MNDTCGIVRDLLPLYIDGVTGDASNGLVTTHLAGCAECAALLQQMKNNELVDRIETEKADVLSGQQKFFRRKSALAGGIIAGILLLPVLVCLIVNLATGSGFDWFLVVLASLLTAGSVLAVPLLAPQNKALWTLGTFTGSLLLLFGVVCLLSGGDWFFVAATASLFGLSVVFLPFAARSRPLSALLKNCKALTVMAADTLLYAAMLTAIGYNTPRPAYFFSVAWPVSLPLLLFAWLLFVILRYIKGGLMKASLCCVLCGAAAFLTEDLTCFFAGNRLTLPVFRPLVWNLNTLDGNLKWLILLSGLFAGLLLGLIALIKRRKTK